MYALIVIGTLAVPVAMLAVQRIVRPLRYVLDIAAVVAAYVFSIVFAWTVYEVLRDNTVFMTTIHKIFANAPFLLASGYLGSYAIYRLMHCAMQAYRSETD